MPDWNNRIIGLEYMPAHQLLAHPDNARRHPAKQREALRGSLDTLGWYDAVIYNKRTGYLVDGHARVEEQLTRDENATLPVLVVDLSEAEEAQALASHDWISQLAEYDKQTLDDLLRQTNSDDKRVQSLLSDLAQEHGVTAYSDIAEQAESFDDSVTYNDKWHVKTGDIYLAGRHIVACADSTTTLAKLLSLFVVPYVVFLDPMYDINKDTFDAIVTQTTDSSGYIALAWGTEISRYSHWLGPFDYDFCIEQSHGLHFTGKPIVRHKILAVWQRGAKLFNKDSIKKYERQSSMQRFSLRPTNRDLEFKYIKPVDMILFAVDINALGCQVVDPFCGSGTTVAACELLGKQCLAVDLEPEAIAATLERLSLMGLQPTLYA